MEAIKRVTIYTDGACSGNPGPGGWGAVLLYGAHRREISGFEASTTNNRMEMMAAIQALRLLREPCEVELYSDSSYLVDAFNKKWIQNWSARGWVKTDKKPVKNQDLWEELVALSSTHKVRFVYVKGHADNPENNRCDQLATGAIRLARGEQNSGAKEGA